MPREDERPDRVLLAREVPGRADHPVGLADTYCKLWPQVSRYEHLLTLPTKSFSHQGKRVNGRRARRLDTDTIEQLVGLYLGGKSTYELADGYGTPRERIVGYLKAAGIALRPGPSVSLDEAARNEIARLYPEGWSLRRLALRFGTSDNTVLKALREQGVPTRSRPGS